MIADRPEGCGKDLVGDRLRVHDACLEQIGADPRPFVVEARTDGFQLCRAAPGSRPRIRFFAEGPDRIVAFCYKPSRLSFSKDRFAYGAVYFYAHDAEARQAKLRQLLDWLDADFAPGCRPSALKRALTFTVPED